MKHLVQAMSIEQRGQGQPVSVAKRKNQGTVSRKLALEVLIKIESQKAYANLALSAAFRRKSLAERDRAFVTALVQGVTRQRLELDGQIAELSTQPLDKMPVSLRNILRMAIFQFSCMKDIPASAVVNTSTELAKTVGHQGLGRFTNGLLRNYLRRHVIEENSGDTTSGASGHARTEEDSLLSEPKIETGESLARRYSMPSWLVKRWLFNYGEAETKVLLEYAQRPPDLVLRTCELSITPEALQQVFTSKGIACHRSHLVPSCLILESQKRQRGQPTPKRGFRGPPEKLPGYTEGLFSIQDEASAFVSIVTDPQPGELIVDLCAAPGGKSLHIAELLKNTGRVLAIDSHESRLKLVKKNRTRLGLTNLETMVADGRTLLLPQLADRVLLDAPCTGTGVINRRTDLRYRKEPVDLIALTNLQRELLANAAQLVRPDGVLIYSTCSIEPEENFDNIRWFLKEHTNFVGDDISQFFPQDFPAEKIQQWEGPVCKTEIEITRLYMLQLLPSRHQTSGFFICRLKRSH